MASMSLPTPTLHTARLRLRPFTDADADEVFALQSNPHVLRYWDSPPWTDRARADRFLAISRKMAEEGTGVRVAVDRVSDDTFIGWCTLQRWNPDFRSASLGYCLTDAAWGQGYATEAAQALLQWAFDTLDLNRVQAEADTRNVGSARVLEKLGFVREGTLREDCVVNGEVSDSGVYGLLRREWRPSPAPSSGRNQDRSMNAPREPVAFEIYEPGVYLHGTKADLAVGDRLVAGRESNYEGGRVMNHVYFTATLDAAVWGAELAAGDGRGRIYVVEPEGEFEDDPNVTDKKFPGNPTHSFRSREPLRVVAELHDWVGHTPEQLQAMLDGLASLKERGEAKIED
jgi:RimJ/RimL family protein N-acetyltransferase